MIGKERILEVARNTATATFVAILPMAAGPTLTHAQESSHNSENHLVLDKTPENLNGRSFLSQLDDFAETKYGKWITHAAFAYALFSAAYSLQKGREIDDKRMFRERIAASSALLALTVNLVANSYTDTDAAVTAGIFTAYTAAQSAYSFENIIQQDRSLQKRLPGTAAIGSLIAINIALLAETFDKY
mgnify:CR=1 FL=1